MAKLIILFVALVTISGCKNTDYKFGDFTKNYCASTDPVFRQTLRNIAEQNGVEVPVDVCMTYGIVDALTKTVKPSK